MKRKPKRRVGRPATGESPMVMFRITPELAKRIAEVVAEFRSRSDAIRKLIERGLEQRILKAGD